MNAIELSPAAFLAIPPAILLVGAGVLGLTVGSFLNVVIRRLPAILEHRWASESAVSPAADAPPSLSWPPSHCPACGKKLKAWHKIPVAGYLMLRGRCGFCDAPVSRQYPAVELLTLIVSLIVAARFGMSIQGFAALAFSWTLIALAFIDYNEQLLPDELTLGLLWAGLIVNAFGVFTDAFSAVLGAAAGYVSLWLVYHGMRLATGRRGLGYGDMKLLAAAGAWCGWEVLPFVLLTASLAGLAAAAAMLAARKMKKDEPMPFGPYLAAGAWAFFVYAFVFGREWPLAGAL